MGVNIQSFVNSVFSTYDQGYSAKGIDVTDESTLDTGKTDLMGVCEYYKTYSNDMFVKADANHDGIMTRQELTNFVGKYDTNHNGQLDDRGWLAKLLHIGGPSELEKFQSQYKETKYRDMCN
ncbi:MAG TPA: hypothetical protein V6D47_06010 [Oscillatoriaceae cyanobacterium]